MDLDLAITFALLDATTVLLCSIAELVVYLAVYLLYSNSPMLFLSLVSTLLLILLTQIMIA